MKILSYNPGHDGAFAYIEDGRLVFSLEAEKGSGYRHSALTVPDAFDALGELSSVPDVLCKSGWWHDGPLQAGGATVGYHGLEAGKVCAGRKRFLGKEIDLFFSSHERSHLLCAFGMSGLPKGTACYALLWEGNIGVCFGVQVVPT